MSVRLFEESTLNLIGTRNFGLGILGLMYGSEIKENPDNYLHNAEMASEAVNVAIVPGAFWIDQLPWLSFIPAWVPGAKFKKVANYYRPFVHAARNEGFNTVWSGIVSTLLDGL